MYTSVIQGYLMQSFKWETLSIDLKLNTLDEFCGLSDRT